MQDPIQIIHDEVHTAARSFGQYNHSGITQIKHPVTGLLVNMALMPVRPYGSKQMAASRAAKRKLRKTLNVTPKEQWSIDRRASVSERGYAKLLGFAQSHIYARPATGRAQPV